MRTFLPLFVFLSYICLSFHAIPLADFGAVDTEHNCNTFEDRLFSANLQAIEAEKDSLLPVIYPHPFVLLQGNSLEEAIVNHNPSESIYSLFPQLQEVDVMVGTPYIDMGAEVFDIGQLSGNPPTLEVVNLVDTSNPTPPNSPFIVQYIATNHLGLKSTVERYVNVVVIDVEAPVILLVEDDPLNPTDNDGSVFEVEVGTEWKDPGYVAYDNLDGLITNKVIVGGEVDTERIGEYTIFYSVIDDAGNIGVITRIVKVKDSQPPFVAMNGINPYIIPCQGEYIEFGANAIDDVDGLLTNFIVTQYFHSLGWEMSEFCTCEPGSYLVRYSATDVSGNTGFDERLVIVVDPLEECNLSCTNCLGSIENLLYHNIEIYPNPTQNHFFVNFNDLTHLQYEAKIEVYDIAGKLVQQNSHLSFQNQVCKIDLEGMTKGIYIAKIETSEGVVSKKLVVR